MGKFRVTSPCVAALLKERFAVQIFLGKCGSKKPECALCLANEWFQSLISVATFKAFHNFGILYLELSQISKQNFLKNIHTLCQITGSSLRKVVIEGMAFQLPSS